MRQIDADALLKDIQRSVEECEKWIDRADEDVKPRAESAFVAFTECALRIKKAPTIEPPRQYVIKAKPETDTEKLKAVFKGLATTPQFEIVPLTPEGFTIEELRSWLYQIAMNNTPSDFEKDVVEIIQRLDGFERFVKERRASNE